MKSLSERLRSITQKIPLSLLNPKVVEKVQGLPQQTPLGIACSGGLDSVALLWILLAHFPERRADFRLVHFNHCLRGDASDGDARFVAQWGDELGMPVYMGSWDNAPDLERVTESDARQARHGFFDQLSKAHGIKYFLLAHHRDDIAENLLLRICRGSGLEGLTGPRPIQPFGDRWTALRPLTAMSKASLQGLLEEMNLSWREDSTNRDPLYDRNALRLDVLPDLERILGNRFARGAALTHAVLNDENEALDFYLEKAMGTQFKSPMDLSPIEGHPMALWRRFFYRWLLHMNLLSGLSRSLIENFLQDIYKGRESSQVLSEGGTLHYKEGCLCLSEAEAEKTRQEWSPVRLTPNVSCFLPQGGYLRAELTPLTADLRAKIFSGDVNVHREAWLDADSCDLNQLSLRLRLAGDYYQPLGAPGGKRLKKLLIDKKISREERINLPVVLSGKDILWAPGLAPAQTFCLGKETNLALRLTYGSG